MAKEAVASAVVWGCERAREAVAGSWMLVRRRGEAGLWRARKARARVCWGLVMVFSWTYELVGWLS